MARIRDWWSHLWEGRQLVRQIDREVTDDEPLASATTATPEEDEQPETYYPLGRSVWDFVGEQLALAKTRQEKYNDYDEMDAECPEVSSALDIYADNATGGDGEDVLAAVTIHTADKRIRKELTALLERLRIPEQLWSYARDVAKYGERTAEVVVGPEYDILRLKPLPTARILPRFDKYGLPEKEAYHQINDAGKVVARFRQWQVVHFALKQSVSHVFGTGIGSAALDPFKKLRLMEMALVVARLTRAHNRLAVGVDTGSLSPPEALKHLNKVRGEARKRRMFNARTGKLDQSWNPLSIEEDLFYGVSKDSKAEVKVLQGDLTIGNINDVAHLQQKVFTAYKVPKAYLANEKDTSSKSVMTKQDLQFARTVRRLQRAILVGLKQVCDLQLRLHAIEAKPGDYTLALPRISVVDSLTHWQSEQLRMLVGRMLKQTFWPKDDRVLAQLGYTAEEIADLLDGQNPPDEYNGLLKQPQVGAVAGEGNPGDPNIDGKTS